MGLFSNFPYSDFENINLDWIIKKVKEYLAKVDTLEIDFNALKEYVTNYFEDLDVQEEINNKLDDMASSGQLAEIIAQYLQSESLITFNTIADMVASDKLIENLDVLCIGKEVYNDGYTNLYKIRTLTSSDIIDGINIIALTNYPTLIAERINVITSNKRRYIFIGDSNMDASSPEYSIMTYLPQYMKLTSSDYYTSALWGAGFTVTDKKFLTLLQNLDSTIVDKDAITDIIVLGGYNDRNATENDILDAIDVFSTYAYSTYPNANIQLGFIGWSADITASFRLSLQKSLKAYQKCGRYNIHFITNSQFIAHDYRLYQDDLKHPNEDGAKNIAQYIASGILDGSCDIVYTIEGQAVELPYNNAINVTEITGTVNQILDNNMAEIFSDNYIRATLGSAVNLTGNTEIAKIPLAYMKPLVNPGGFFVTGRLLKDGAWVKENAWAYLQGNLVDGCRLVVNFGAHSNVSTIEIWRINFSMTSLWC